MTMIFHPTSTAGVNIAASACEARPFEPGLLVSMGFGQQAQLSTRLTEWEWEEFKRRGDEAIDQAGVIMQERREGGA